MNLLMQNNTRLEFPNTNDDNINKKGAHIKHACRCKSHCCISTHTKFWVASAAAQSHQLGLPIPKVGKGQVAAGRTGA